MTNLSTLLLRRVATPAMILLFSFAPAFAQLEQGRWLVGGGLGGAYIGINNQRILLWNGQQFISRYDSQAGLNLGTNLGYFLTDKVVIGGNFSTGISLSGQEYFNALNTSWNIGAGPFIRYYAVSLGSGAALFGGAYFGYSFSMASIFYYSQPVTTHQLNPNLNFGGTWFLTKNIALEGYIAYERRFLFASEKPPFITGVGNIPSPTYSENTGSLTLSVGFQIFLDKLF